MSEINAGLLQDSISYIERVYEDNYNRTQLLQNMGGYCKIKYSTNRTSYYNQFLSTYLKLKQYTPPRLYNSLSFNNSSYTEYFFENNCLKRKVVYSTSEDIVDYYFVDHLNVNLRLGFKGNVLREIHSCRYQNGFLMQVDNAVFSQFGQMSIISTEKYIYLENRIKTCLNYRDYSPIYPMFIRKNIMGRDIVVNPSITEYKLIYGEAGDLQQYIENPSEKVFFVDKRTASYFNHVDNADKINRIVLW